MKNKLIAVLLISVLSCVGLVSESWAQPVHPGDERVELGVVMRQLNTVGTFMMATAHPDDENNALLALLARGQGHRTILATATRGDGGQNEIGPELFDALAVLRTEELLAAHRLDGAEQFFTRAVDFGYSFSQNETFERWGREEILSDFVRLIRTTRPDVVTALSSEGQGGGQHHQASAILAREAFSAAADPHRFPEQVHEGLRPWQAKKFYFSVGFGFQGRGRRQPPPTDATTINLAGYDTLLGRTYAEIGSQARSMHKCQGMSQLIALPGQAAAHYRLADTMILGQAERNELSLFDGIDTSIEGLIRFAGEQPPAELRGGLSRIADYARSGLDAFEAGGIDVARDLVVSGLEAVRSVRSSLNSYQLSEESRWEIDFRLAAKERQFKSAVILTHGLRLEALASDGVVTPGQPLSMSVLVANRGTVDVVIKGVRLAGLDGSPAACIEKTLVAADVYSCSLELRVPNDVTPTSIHWTHVPGTARYAFDNDVPFGVPFRSTSLTVAIEIEFVTGSVIVEQPIEYRYGDDIFAGEKRTTLNVVPRLAVGVSPEVAIIPRQAGGMREVRVTVSNAWPGPIEGSVSLDLPDGWTATPTSNVIRFSREDEEQTFRFSVTAGGVAGTHTIRAMVQTSDGLYDSGYQVVEYPHIGRRHLVRSARSTMKVIDVNLPANLTVGYIEGVGDEVPSAIEQLGAAVEFIDVDKLAWGDLSSFDVIVTGVRAYESRPDLRANNDRLLQYVESGGILIVQYNKFEFNDAQYGPYVASVSRNRVTAEDAPVRLLITDHPVFEWPNEIGPDTWNDWVQERGLYFLGDKDSSYVDLVELEDTFEWNPGPKRGALVEARYGQGRWIYVGLGLWRQLPAGTIGAYQLLANLLSLGAVN